MSADGNKPSTNATVDPERLAVLERVADAASVNVSCWRFACEAEANPDLQSGDLVKRTTARMNLHRTKAEANRYCLALTHAVDAYHEFEDARAGLTKSGES